MWTKFKNINYFNKKINSINYIKIWSGFFQFKILNPIKTLTSTWGETIATALDSILYSLISLLVADPADPLNLFSLQWGGWAWVSSVVEYQFAVSFRDASDIKFDRCWGLRWVSDSSRSIWNLSLPPVILNINWSFIKISIKSIIINLIGMSPHASSKLIL